MEAEFRLWQSHATAVEAGTRVKVTTAACSRRIDGTENSERKFALSLRSWESPTFPDRRGLLLKPQPYWIPFSTIRHLKSDDRRWRNLGLNHWRDDESRTSSRIERSLNLSAPLGPTKAMRCPGRARREIPFKTGSSGRVGEVQVTLENASSPAVPEGPRGASG